MSKDVWDLSDDELEAAFQAAKAEMGSPDTAYEEEREEEHEAEDLEQPVDDEDSDDSADTDVSDETTNDEDSEAESDTPDGESADEDEEPETEEGEAQAEVQPIQKHKFKANGREYEFSDEEVREQFPKIFGQAMDYTKKMQALKPWRQSIDALESNGLSHEDVNLHLFSIVHSLTKDFRKLLPNFFIAELILSAIRFKFMLLYWLYFCLCFAFFCLRFLILISALPVGRIALSF
jgi:hypothetical protein